MITCTPGSTRYRWKAGAGGPPKTTKSTTATTKASSNTKTNKTTKAASSGGSSGGLTTTGAAVTGRFCAKADDGRRGTSDKGIKLICRADAAGKNRVAGGLIGLLLPDGAGRLIRPAGGRAIGTS